MKSQFASLLLLGGGERMMRHSTCSSPVFFLRPQKENPAWVWLEFHRPGGLLCFQWAGASSNSKRGASVFIIPPPSMKSPTLFCAGEVRGESQSSEEFCYEWHRWNSVLDECAARLTMNNDFLFDRVCPQVKRGNGAEMDFITVLCSNLSQSVRVKKVVLVTTVLAQYWNFWSTKYKNKLKLWW